MSQHTEGPWKALSAGRFIEGEPGHEKTRDYPAHVVAITTEDRCRVTRFICECSGAGLPNNANARLIAAAPDMLAALKRADEALENAYGDLGPVAPNSQAGQDMALVKAAIQKAEGNS